MSFLSGKGDVVAWLSGAAFLMLAGCTDSSNLGSAGLILGEGDDDSAESPAEANGADGGTGCELPLVIPLTRAEPPDVPQDPYRGILVYSYGSTVQCAYDNQGSADQTRGLLSFELEQWLENDGADPGNPENYNSSTRITALGDWKFIRISSGSVFSDTDISLPTGEPVSVALAKAVEVVNEPSARIFEAQLTIDATAKTVTITAFSPLE